jgi:hypothetical protein
MPNQRSDSQQPVPGVAVADAVHILDKRQCVPILALLTYGRANVSELAHRLKWQQPPVSRALALLLDAGWVNCDRQGKWHHYWLSGTPVVHRSNQHLIVRVEASDGNLLHMVRTFDCGWTPLAEKTLPNGTVKVVDAPAAGVIIPPSRRA